MQTVQQPWREAQAEPIPPARGCSHYDNWWGYYGYGQGSTWEDTEMTDLGAAEAGAIPAEQAAECGSRMPAGALPAEPQASLANHTNTHCRLRSPAATQGARRERLETNGPYGPLPKVRLFGKTFVPTPQHIAPVGDENQASTPGRQLTRQNSI